MNHVWIINDNSNELCAIIQDKQLDKLVEQLKEYASRFFDPEENEITVRSLSEKFITVYCNNYEVYFARKMETIA